MVARDLSLRRNWPEVHVGASTFSLQIDGSDVSVAIYLGQAASKDIRVEAYAQSIGCGDEVIALSHGGMIPGATSGFVYVGRISGVRPAEDYTVRVVPSHPGVRVPAETTLIHWQR